LNLAKAFDKSVDHRILLKKLEYYGIRGIPLLWFKNYLDNRLQQVRCNGIFSSLKPIRCGVPQGSNRGPFLFLIYINDLPSVSHVLKFILFADDTNALCSHKPLPELKQMINTELVLLAEWFKTNRLSLNVKKTSSITFHSPNKTILNSGNKLSLEGIAIEQVSSTKFLGIYIDECLTWKEHVKVIASKIAINLGILRKISYLLPSKILINLYCTLVNPYFL